LPENFTKLKKALDVLRALQGTKYCELEMGITENIEPCAFDDPGAWMRGIADLLIVDGAKGYVVDYKTGSSRYPDKDQLLLMSLMAFAKFPELEHIKAALVFIKDSVLVRTAYTREEALATVPAWRQRTERLDAAQRSSFWPERPNGLCRRYCPARSCAHNGGYNG
jgi:RecB family exonuclease